MNPLLKHKVLQHLPYEQLKNPEKDKIKAYLQKKVRTFKILKMAFILFFPLYLYDFFINLSNNPLGTGWDIFGRIVDTSFIFISIPIVIFILHKLQKDYDISESEIESEIEKITTERKIDNEI